MSGRTTALHTVRLPEEPDAIAPDGSEIRLLGRMAGASVAHGSLAPGAVSAAVAHRTIDEVWVALAGEAEHWRALDGREETVLLRAGMAIAIPVGTAFQFRVLGEVPFQFLMCTSPAWPGDDEAYLVTGPWAASGDGL